MVIACDTSEAGVRPAQVVPLDVATRNAASWSPHGGLNRTIIDHMFERGSVALDGKPTEISSSPEERAALVALLRERPGRLSWIELADAVIRHGSAASARRAVLTEDLFGLPSNDELVEAAQRDLADWAQRGYSFWSILDAHYPERVRDIHEAPPFLFARGVPLQSDRAVSVVGSRKASVEGLRMARAISEMLVSKNISVVAGLAAGIDAAAHETALKAGGRTVAVIGTGLNRAYPAENRGLQDEIAERGLLLSQFWPDAPPQQHNFPMRNAVMSGYGIATVVVEAGEHSGARIQARKAVEHGRPVVLTDLVVNRTQWGKDLLARPGVHQATSLQEAAEVVDALATAPDRLHEALAQVRV